MAGGDGKTATGGGTLGLGVAGAVGMVCAFES